MKNSKGLCFGHTPKHSFPQRGDMNFSFNMKISSPKHKVAFITLCPAQYIIMPPLSKNHKKCARWETKNEHIPDSSTLRLFRLCSRKVCSVQALYEHKLHQILSISIIHFPVKQNPLIYTCFLARSYKIRQLQTGANRKSKR